MTSDELEAWGDAISESFAQGEVYTVQSTFAGSARAVSVSALESSLLTGTDLDGREVLIDKETGVGSFVQPGPRRMAAMAAASSKPWTLSVTNPGYSSIYTGAPGFGYYPSGGPEYGISALSPGGSSSSGVSLWHDRSFGTYGGQQLPVSVEGDVVLNLFAYVSDSNALWKGSPGWLSYNVLYSLQSLNQQIALDSYINFYQSWWYYTDSTGNNIKERMRVKPDLHRVSLVVNNRIFSDGSTIFTAEDGTSYVFHCDAWDDVKGWHVYITDGNGNLAAMKLPYVVSKLGFTAEFGGEDRVYRDNLRSVLDQSAFVQLETTPTYGWLVSTVFLWKSGDGFVFGDAASGTDLTEVINAINQNTLTTANGCAQIVDAVNQQGGQIVDVIGGLPGKIASGLTPSEADVQSGVSDIQAKFSASYGNTKSLVDMVENLYVTLKDGFSGASEVTTWDFPGIKVKLNGSVHTICPEISVQKTDIGMQQYLVLVVRVICVIALVWMIWSKVHRVIIPKEADD